MEEEEEYKPLEELLAAGDPAARRAPWCAFDEFLPDGMPRPGGTAVEPLAFAWGSCMDDVYSSLPWLKVSTLTIPGDYVLGYLYAAVFSGKVYLRLSATELQEVAADVPALAENQESAEGGAEVAACDANGIPLPAALREQVGGFQLVPDGEQEAWLKVGAQWRTDVFWEPILPFCSWGMGAPLKRVALCVWLVAIDEVLCFYTRSGFMEDGTGRWKASYFGEEALNYDTTALNMPWGDDETWEAPEDGDFQAPCGTADAVAEIGDGGLPLHQASCGELVPVTMRTFSESNWPFWWFAPTVSPGADEVAGEFNSLPGAVAAYFRGEITPRGIYKIGGYWFEACGDGVNDYPPSFDNWWANSRWPLVDPLLLPLYGSGWDAEAMEAAPDVMEYKPILSAQLPWPLEDGWGYGRGLYVLLRGASLYGAGACICSVTETPYVVTGGDDPDPEPGPGPIPEPDPGPGIDDPPDPDPIDPEPDPDPDWDPPPPGPGPGPNPGPTPTPTPTPTPSPGPSPVTRPTVGWWYRGGDGVTVSAARKVGKNFHFDVAVSGFAADDSTIGINAYVKLTASGGGSGNGGAVNWGFDNPKSGSSLTATTDNQWSGSGWVPATPPSTTAEDYRTISCKVTAGVRMGEFIACSNMRLKSDDAIIVTASGTFVNRTIDGQKVKYEICYITARKVRLKKKVAQQALATCPLSGHTVTPGSVTGSITQSGENPPTISAAAGKTECFTARTNVAISAPYKVRWGAIRHEASSTMSVGGGSEWNKDGSRYSGELSGTFTINMPEKTFKNY